GVERSDLGRGHVACDERLSRLTARLDARVEIRPAAKRPIASHTRVRFHLGTAEVMGKLVLLGGHDELPPRSAGWAQLVLVEPVLAMRGDRFILREETARRTLGGGAVVNPFADRHRRAEAGLEERLEVLRGGEPPAAARRLVREESVVRAPGHRVALGVAAHALGARVERLLAEGRFTPPDLRQLEEATGAARKALADVLGVLEAEGKVARIAPDLYYARAAADEAKAIVEAHCRAHGEITA